MIVKAFKNTSNFSKYRVIKDGEEYNLTAAGITKIQAVAGGAALSSEDGNIVFTGSELSVKWGSFNLDAGNYPVKIYAYTTSDTAGQLLFGDQCTIHLNVYADERLLIA